MDVGPSPASKFSSKYQSGALSFEINSNGKKLISNCGYYDNKNTKLIELSKSTATQSTLIIDDSSSCHYKKNSRNFIVRDALKILKKNIVFEKNYWKINASHDGYQKKYCTVHEREIEFYPEHFKFIGKDIILSQVDHITFFINDGQFLSRAIPCNHGIVIVGILNLISLAPSQYSYFFIFFEVFY